MNRTSVLISSLIIGILVCVLCGVALERWLAQPDDVRQMQLGNTSYELEIADSILEQRRGLMNRDQLDANRGMYFQFSESQQRLFWMKNTRIPLDLIWVNRGVVIGVTLNVQPEPGVTDLQLQLYGSPGPADAVIELNAGEVAQNGLTIGDRIQFDSSQ